MKTGTLRRARAHQGPGVRTVIAFSLASVVNISRLFRDRGFVVIKNLSAAMAASNMAATAIFRA